MRKPDSVKNVETPRNPPGAHSNRWWKHRTPSRATARNPSRAGTYRSAGMLAALGGAAGRRRRGPVVAGALVLGQRQGRAAGAAEARPVGR